MAYPALTMYCSLPFNIKQSSLIEPQRRKKWNDRKSCLWKPVAVSLWREAYLKCWSQGRMTITGETMKCLEQGTCKPRLAYMSRWLNFHCYCRLLEISIFQTWKQMCASHVKILVASLIGLIRPKISIFFTEGQKLIDNRTSSHVNYVSYFTHRVWV